MKRNKEEAERWFKQAEYDLESAKTEAIDLCFASAKNIKSLMNDIISEMPMEGNK